MSRARGCSAQALNTARTQISKLKTNAARSGERARCSNRVAVADRPVQRHAILAADEEGEGRERLRAIIEYKEEVTLFSNVPFMGILDRILKILFFFLSYFFKSNLALDKWT